MAKEETIKKEKKKKAEKKPVVKKKPAVKKKVVADPVAEEPEIEVIVDDKKDRYFEAVGRRKTAIARVRLYTKGKKDITINDKPYDKYFPTNELQEDSMSALKKMKCFDKFTVVVKVKGGGLSAQSEAVRHGTSRALVLFNEEFRKRLRRVGYLTRDPRARERKKFGLKRARRAPQWKKR
ncbi:MAG: 30S ribosomal protein S9 [Candidatus Nealsonbacteria bacterium]|nr:30S ribosomal protein S9 [Candidatus Nealsonbacteria bacterium]